MSLYIGITPLSTEIKLTLRIVRIHYTLRVKVAPTRRLHH